MILVRLEIKCAFSVIETYTFVLLINALPYPNFYLLILLFPEPVICPFVI